MPLLNTKSTINKINTLLQKNAKSYYEIGTLLMKLKDKIESFDDKKKKNLAKNEYIEMVDNLPFKDVVSNKQNSVLYFLFNILRTSCEQQIAASNLPPR